MSPTVLYILLALSLVAALQIFTGIANNADYWRSSDQFILRTLAHQQLLFIHWQNIWILNPKLSFIHLFPPVIFPSSYQLLLSAQVLLNKLFYKHGLYSMILASMLPRAIWLGLFFGVCYELRKILQGWALVLSAIFLWLLFNDTAFVQFFNSFYQGQAGCIFLVLLFYVILRMPEKLNLKYFILIALSLSLLTTAKTQYMFTPLVIAICFALAAWYLKSHPYRKTLIILAFGSLLIGIPLLAAQVMLTKNKTMAYFGHPELLLSKNDAYNAYYMGVLTLFHKDKLKEYAPDANPSCVGAWTLTKDSDGKGCIYATHSSYRKVISLYLLHPVLIARGLNHVRKKAIRSRLNYLSKTREQGRSFDKLFIFNIWNGPISYVLRELYYPIILILIFSAFYLRKFWLENPRWFIASSFMLIFSFSQYAMVLADGFHEAAKHALLGNLSYMLSFLFIAIFSVVQLIDKYSRRQKNLKR